MSKPSPLLPRRPAPKRAHYPRVGTMIEHRILGLGIVKVRGPSSVMVKFRKYRGLRELHLVFLLPHNYKIVRAKKARS